MPLVDTAWYVNYGNGSSTGYYAVTQWATAAVTAAGAVRRQLAAPAVGSERIFIAIVAGITHATTEPTWTVTRGAKTTDNTVTWQEATGQPGLCGDTTNCTVWLTVKNTAVVLGQVIYDSGTSSLQICSTAGTAGNGATPGFSATAGTTTADNTVTWTSLGLASGFSTAFGNPHARVANAFASTWGAAGNQFAVASTHAETQSTTITLTSPGTAASPCAVYCLTSTTTLASPTLNTTASISTTGVSNINGPDKFVYCYGLKFIPGNSSNQGRTFLGVSSTSVQYYESCTFDCSNTTSTTSGTFIGNSSNAVARYIQLTNCTFIFGNASQQINFGGGHFEVINATIAASGTVPTTAIAFGNAGGGNGGSEVVIRDTDLSNITGNLCAVNAVGAMTAYLQNCKLANAVTPVTGSFTDLSAVYFKMHNCDSTNTNYRYYYGNYCATVQQETTIVRTGSLATNGTTPISWAFVTTANAKFLQPFQSEEIMIWNDLIGSALTLTLYLISNTTLNNNDFWAQAELLGTSSFPFGTIVTSRMTTLGTAAALTADTSTWGGSTNKYAITLSVTPQVKGPIKVRFFAAKASATTYVDPFIYVTDATGNLKSSGRSFFIPGWGYSSESAPSFMDLTITGGING